MCGGFCRSPTTWRIGGPGSRGWCPTGAALRPARAGMILLVEQKGSAHGSGRAVVGLASPDDATRRRSRVVRGVVVAADQPRPLVQDLRADRGHDSPALDRPKPNPGHGERRRPGLAVAASLFGSRTNGRRARRSTASTIWCKRPPPSELRPSEEIGKPQKSRAPCSGCPRPPPPASNPNSKVVTCP